MHSQSKFARRKRSKLLIPEPKRAGAEAVQQSGGEEKAGFSIMGSVSHAMVLRISRRVPRIQLTAALTTGQ
jgi:hypothetical protein